MLRMTTKLMWHGEIKSMRYCTAIYRKGQEKTEKENFVWQDTVSGIRSLRWATWHCGSPLKVEKPQADVCGYAQERHWTRHLESWNLSWVTDLDGRPLPEETGNDDNVVDDRQMRMLSCTVISVNLQIWLILKYQNKNWIIIQNLFYLFNASWVYLDHLYTFEKWCCTSPTSFLSPFS